MAARRSDLHEEIESAAREHEGSGSSSPRKTEQKVRRARALSMRLAGFTLEEIGDNLGVSAVAAHELVNSTLERSMTRDVETMRAEENARLDKAQVAIWKRVLEGDDKAIDRYLKISQQRARINGLNAAIKVDLSVSVKHEMEQALSNLETLVIEHEHVPTPRSEMEELASASAQEDVVDQIVENDPGWSAETLTVDEEEA